MSSMRICVRGVQVSVREGTACNRSMAGTGEYKENTEPQKGQNAFQASFVG